MLTDEKLDDAGARLEHKKGEIKLSLYTSREGL
jgi:hypothetical protein